jgi:hypothetical protein
MKIFFRFSNAFYKCAAKDFGFWNEVGRQVSIDDICIGDFKDDGSDYVGFSYATRPRHLNFAGVEAMVAKHHYEILTPRDIVILRLKSKSSLKIIG